MLFLTSQPEKWLERKGKQSGAGAEVRCFRVAFFVILLKFVEAENCRLSKLKSTILGEES